MEFLWFLLIIFVVLMIFVVCPPVGAVVGLFVGLVGLIVSPILIWLAYRSDKSIHDGDE